MSIRDVYAVADVCGMYVIDVRTYELEEHGFRTYEFHSRICNAFPAKTIILQSHKGLCLSV